MKTIAILQHESGDPPGGIADALVALQLPFTVIDLGAGDPLPASPHDVAALVLLGGEMHVHQEEQFPFLRAERELLAACLHAQTPVLAICLGAQLLAAEAGGTVYRRSLPEIGWFDVDIVAHDSLMHGIASPFRAFQWHQYSFTLPPGALRIADRPDGEQVFRAGPRAWGLQFHPEVDARHIEEWLRDAEAHLEGVTPAVVAEVRAETEAQIGEQTQLCARLVTNFAIAAGIIAASGTAS